MTEIYIIRCNTSNNKFDNGYSFCYNIIVPRGKRTPSQGAYKQ